MVPRCPIRPRPPTPATSSGSSSSSSCFNFIDRQILAILLEPIKRDLGVSRHRDGLPHRHRVRALLHRRRASPIARLADRGTRRTVIALGLAAWSAMTALSGMVRTFGELALARIGVGIGEAACSPPAHSLLADYFPPERRADRARHLLDGHPRGRALRLRDRRMDGPALRAGAHAFFVVGAAGSRARRRRRG